MSVPFDPQQGLIVVPAELWGPTSSMILRVAHEIAPENGG